MAFACRHDRLLLRTVVAGMLVVVVLRSATLRAQAPAPGGPERVAPLPAATADVPAPHERVLDIRVTGNRTITREKVLANIGTKVNHPFDQATFDADVRKLVGKSWFVHVEPIRERTAGGIIITLRVVERPTLEEVRYLGWRKVKPKTLAKQTGLKKGDPLDPYAIEEAARKLETYYQTKGFNDIKVEVLEGDKPSDRRAVFLINEGKIQKIWKVRFEGNYIASDGRLKTQIQSKPPVLWLFKGYVDRSKIEGDVERVTDYYRGLGFFKAHVGRDYEWDEDEEWMTLVIYITEGPRYKIRDIAFAGNSIYDNAALSDGLKLKPGDYFDRAAMNADIGYLKDVYGANGYVFADAQPDLQFDLYPGELDLLYKVTEGQQCLVGDINVHIGGDNPHTRLITAVNRSTVRPGDVIDIRQIRALERRLKSSGLFNVDPSKGDVPRVVLTPPDGEGDGPEGNQRNVARGNGDSGVRGQSLDPPRRQPSVRYQSPAGGSNSYGGTAVNELSPGGMSYTAPREGAATAQNPYAAAAQSTPPAPSRGMPPYTTNPPASPAPNRLAAPAGSYAQAPYGAAQRYPQQQPAAGYPSQPAGYQTPPSAYAAQPAAYQAPAPVAAPQAGNPYAVQPGTGYSTQAAGTSVAQAPGGGYSTQPPIVGAPPPGAIYAQNNGAAPGGYPSGYGAGPPDQPGGSLPFPNPEPLLPPDDRPRIPVDIYLNEAQTGRFMFGAGVNSNAGLVGSIVLDEQNFDWRRFPTSWEDFRSGRAFRGDGQKFRIEAAPGTQVSRYMFNFAEPYLFDTPVSLGLSGYYFQRFYRDWNEQRTGGRTSLGYQFSPDLSGALAFRGEDVLVNGVRSGIDPATVPPLEAALGHTQMYSFTGTMAWDTRDSTFLPTEGNYVALSVGYTVGTFQFPTYTVDFRKFFMLRQRPDGSGRHVLSLYNQFGITGSDTPIYERFYAGGFSTLRGFQFRGASPQINTVEVGGDFQNLSSVEYMFPLTADDMLRAVVFVDFGTVEQSVTINWDQFRVAPGAGLRISLPALGPAPIALDIAVPVAYADTDIKQLFSFFVGYSR